MKDKILGFAKFAASKAVDVVITAVAVKLVEKGHIPNPASRPPPRYAPTRSATTGQPFLDRVRRLQEDVATGHLDLRYVGEAIGEGFDQDFPAEILAAAVASATSGAHDSSVLQNDLKELLILVGLPAGAQPESPHELFQRALRRLRPSADRRDWADVYKGGAHDPAKIPQMNSVVVITHEAARLALGALDQQQRQDAYHNGLAAMREISDVLRR